MPEISPLSLISTISTHDNIEPDDIVVTKRSLQRLGHYRPSKLGLTELTDDALFAGIESFQQDKGLNVDGLMHPDGETAVTIGRELSTRTPRTKLAFHPHLPRMDDTPSDEQCDHLYWNVDIPTCRGILAKRGRRGAARCFHTATLRYALCLKGRPIDELPPLDTWAN